MKTVENVAARAQSARFVFFEYLSKGCGLLLALTLQVAVSYRNHLKACLENFVALGGDARTDKVRSDNRAKYFSYLVGTACFDSPLKTAVVRELTLAGVDVPKKANVAALVDLCNANKLQGHTWIARGRIYRVVELTATDIEMALIKVETSLTNDQEREAKYTQAETYKPTLDDSGEPIPGMKTHTLSGVGYVQGLVTKSSVVKAYDGSPIANVYGDGIEAGVPKVAPLSSGEAMAVSEINSVIGRNRWRTIRVDRCVYVKADGHVLGNRHVENPHSTRRDTHTG